jgi:hypothetical protein
MISIPDGTEIPLHCCPTCAEEIEPSELPARIPPQSATAPEVASPAIA